jgi:S1-C subfamily serine protease
MHKTIATLLLLVTASALAASQKARTTDSQNIPIATQALLEGVKSPESKGVIKSVLMIQCPRDAAKGTGFVLSGGGIITTNSHVVGSCNAEDLVGISAVSNEPVKFTQLERDPNRDLALLCPTKPLPFSLELNGDERPPVETDVETWGYPLRYNDRAPILSRGYVAGYRMNQKSLDSVPVSRIIVNGAFNPGNSGGPLINRDSHKLIGIVVEKWFLDSPNIESVVYGLAHPGAQTVGGVPMYITDENGERKAVSQQIGTSKALEELYKQSQVMVGEAISVSELNAFIAEKRQALGCSAR